MKIPSQRPSVTFFSFTSCEGCQLVVLNAAETFPTLLKHLKIVNFREAMDPTSDQYDIAFVEGSISTRTELRKIKHIRANADIVIALGACAAIGGINCIQDAERPISIKKARELVYGKDADKHRLLKGSIKARPVNQVIEIDHYLHGCPISAEELLTNLTDLMIGRKPKVVNHPVCTDCKMAGNICVFEKERPAGSPPMLCNGPVTRGGCQAICVTYGETCWGCRGYVDNPNIEAHTRTLLEHGLTAKEARATLTLYKGYEKTKNKTGRIKNA